jgi:hypothetical protein
MFSRIRQRITYANVAMTLALVFAMTGGAYAAGKYLITSTKQISPKVLKQLQGKTGKTGPASANGANGAQGPAGANGKDGTNGTNGTPGGAGTSVTSTKLAAENANCKEGGSEFTAANGKTFACNGSPWAVGGLPKGASETGEWSLYHAAPEAELFGTAISFTVSLAEALPEANVHFIMPGASPLPTGCNGTPEKPEAASGSLCVFAKVMEGIEPGSAIGFTTISGLETAVGADPSGAQLTFYVPAKGQVTAKGSWAVTG